MAGCHDPAVHDNVKDYYGKRVKKSDDLMTNCCTVDRDAFSTDAKEAMKLIHPEVLSKNYGCGAVYPEAVAGCKVLDLGSGAGLDCFVLSKLVGPKGHVTGIDMTKEQLEMANKHIDYHTGVFGYSEPNVEFVEGFIETLGAAGLQDQMFDVIISNCVINLSPDKESVLREAYRVLKTGGEMYFSDIYSNRPVPDSLKENKVLWGECISGAMEWKELMKLATEIGFAPPVLVSSTLYKCEDTELTSMLETSGCSGLQFCSATYRLMKVEPEPAAQGNVEGKEEEEEPLVEVLYKGTISGCKASMKFSCQMALRVDHPVVMTSSVAAVLQSCPRLSPHFTFTSPPSQQALQGGGATILTTPLAQFVDVDPFEMSSKSVVLAPPKALPSSGQCCGEGKEYSDGENNSSSQPPTCQAAEKDVSTPSGGDGGCCEGNGSCEPPQSKRQCCET